MENTARNLEAPRIYSYKRVSGLEQVKGTGQTRQDDLAEIWCQEHGFTLDTTLKLSDPGKSAFHGTHVARGALGEFYAMVQRGEIPRGSKLLVENLDRLSREKPRVAFQHFFNLINAGITIITLADGKEYSQENIDENYFQLFETLITMGRANDESEVKSKRGKETWKYRRERASKGKVISAMAPAWLTTPKVNPENPVERKFTVIPEAAATINQLYQMKLEGKGLLLIAKTLNQTKGAWLPPRSGVWSKSYVSDMLRNRQLLGESHLIK
jgi:DNA invertase Pin-like site-specific DNA recombinase